MKSNKKYFVFCPPYYATGGTELLHQLTFQLIENGIDAKICYGKLDVGNKLHPTPDKFIHYVNNKFLIEDPIDSYGDVYIFPEVFSIKSNNYKKGIKLFWWLSVDNFHKSIEMHVNEKYSFFYFQFIKSLIKNKIIKNFINKSNIKIHLYQSEYARLFLTENNISNYFYLSDYLATEFTENNIVEQRKNIVLYNPRKGFENILKLIEKDKINEWIALDNLTTDELIVLYKTAKVYVDFGHHPGKDRIPREAAVNGCIVITSKRGSCKNNIDVPIHPQYKLEENEIKNTEFVLRKINNCIINYNDFYIDFYEYKKLIKNEKIKFIKDIITLIFLIEFNNE
jgi:hypothetical protein